MSAASVQVVRTVGGNAAPKRIVEIYRKILAPGNDNDVNQSERGRSELMQKFENEHWLKALASEYKITGKLADEFALAVDTIALDFVRRSRTESLPEKPVREFLPRKDKIIDYIRAADGLGPWLEAGVLTRPLLNKLSPKAYVALANWLQRHDMPADLSIPTKSETLTAEARQLANAGGDLRERARVVNRFAGALNYRAAK
jgi:hypothetical protein